METKPKKKVSKSSPLASPGKRPVATATGPIEPRVARPMPASPTEPNPPGLWMKLGGAGLVLFPVGYFLRRDGLGKQDKVKEIQKQKLLARDKDKRESLAIEEEKLKEQSGNEVAAGTAIGLAGISLFLMGLLIFRNVRHRRAALVCIIPLILAALCGVYEAGIVSMVLSALVTLAFIYYVTGEPDPKKTEAFEEFRRFPTRRELAPEIGEVKSYLALQRKVRSAAKDRVLRKVPELPAVFARFLPTIGEGKVFGLLQLREGLAYVAFVEADNHNVSDYVTVLLKLDERAPVFTARPLPILDGVRVPNVGLKFVDDPEFRNNYLVEIDPRSDSKAVKAFLSPIVREELLTLPATWMHVGGDVMALTLFGRYDPEAIDHLVDLADVIFAEYGAEGGPSLIEPESVIAKKAPATGTAPAPA